jgi:hypothetical protein
MNMSPSRRTTTFLACTIACSATGTCLSVTEFFYDQASWESAVESVDEFPFTPANLLLADEVQTVPDPGESLLTTVLTFPGSATGLPYDFQVHGVHDELYFNEYAFHYAIDHLGVGPMSMTDDDWELMFPAGGAPIHAVGFLVVDNDAGAGETVTVFDLAGQVIGTAPTPYQPGEHELFFGVVSTEPIGRVLIDEEAAHDNADFALLMFGTELSCHADVNGSGAVDITDLQLVLAAWGATSGPEDINADGIVNVLDALLVLGQWGPCP